MIVLALKRLFLMAVKLRMYVGIIQPAHTFLKFLIGRELSL